MGNYMRFGIDVDGVLGNFGASVITTANKLWPGKMAHNYVPDNWDYTDVLSPEDWSLVWDEIKHTPNFWLNELPYTSSIQELRRFINNEAEDADIFFITSRATTIGASVLQQTSQWLKQESLFPLDGRASVIPVADAKHKEAVCAALKITHFLDDYAPTVQKLQTVEGLQAYVLDQPWNRYAAHLPRVFSVGEYLSRVQEGQ